MSEDIWPSSDPLGKALQFLRIEGTLYTCSEFSAPWSLELPTIDGSLMLHVVISGRCQLRTKTREPRILSTGDLAVVPHGDGHFLFSDRDVASARLFDLDREKVGDRYEILRHGRGGERTRMVCVTVQLHDPLSRRFVSLLPDLIVIGRGHPERSTRLTGLLHMMESEARASRPGGETIITRIADILVIDAIRSWIDETPLADTGWSGALRDERIVRTLALIHNNPGDPWTVASLASHAGMSRSSFAERFSELVGEPPLRYLTWWRMISARTALIEDKTSVGELARRMGYESEPAFSRVFKRFFGVSPAIARREKSIVPSRKISRVS